MLPINYILLEGPDLVGKTSLFSSLHRSTAYRYNIIDRSSLSNLCYARLYGRPDEEPRRRLREEISNLNNVILVLLLPREEILERLASRGDEFQDAVSLMRLYDIFSEEVAKICSAPNVFVVRDVMDPSSLTNHVASLVSNYENSSPGEVGRSLAGLVKCSDLLEDQVRFTLKIDPTHRDHLIMSDPKETHYYNGIMTECSKIIRRELDGINPYNKPQDLTSRRFFYSSDTCISSVHFLPRAGGLKVLCGLRSTDVVRNGEIDTRFLAHLSAFIPRSFDWPTDRIYLTVFFNSAHIRTDIVD